LGCARNYAEKSENVKRKNYGVCYTNEPDPYAKGVAPDSDNLLAKHIVFCFTILS